MNHIVGMLEGLNDEQRRAAETIDGPLLILAGAGSGKTKTLTHRIAHIVTTCDVWPEQILAVTFTNKAAKEMRSRLWTLLKTDSRYDTEQIPRNFMPWMGTFHSICVRMLRLEGSVIGVMPNFVIYDEDDRQTLIKRAVKECRLENAQVKPRALSAAISKAKNLLLTPTDYAETARFPFEQHVAAVYASYEQQRHDAGALDFDDLLVETVRLLRDKPDIRNKWRQNFRHILIDEYQDTNAAQYEIVKLLVNDERNICVVGDDWQSIYSWRGADFTNILNFERDFPGAIVIKLEQNYRSTSAILDAAHAVITKNTQRTDKAMWTDKSSGLPVAIHPVYDESEEAFSVASRVRTQVQSGTRSYKDFAVLYRMNAQSYALERALIQQRIPYQIVGGVRFYDRMEVKDIIAYLRLAVLPTDIVSFSRIVNVPKRGIGATSVEKFLVWQQSSGLDIVSALVTAETADSVPARVRPQLARLGEMMRQLQRDYQNETAPGVIIGSLIDRISYREYLLDGTPGGEEREANLSVLVSDAHNFASLQDYLEEVALMSSVDTVQSGEAVTLMTLHAAKGLEFPVVWMVGMEEGVLPHSRVFDGSKEELEEERRLCYVGMTRAREELHVSYASSRLQFGQRTYSAPSRFLEDMGTAVMMASTDSTEADTRSEFFGDMHQFEVGDRVRSLQFGSGEIVDVDGMAVSIVFDNGQQKKLNVEFARLEKLA